MTDLLARLRIEASAATVPIEAAKVEKAMAGVRAGVQQTGAAMAASEAGANRMAAGLDRAGDQAQRFDQRARGAALGVGALGGALGAAAVGSFISDITKAAFAAGGLQTGVAAVTDGAGQAKVELAFVRQEAARLGLVAQETSRNFLELAGATNETALEGAKTREIWLATAESGMALARTPEQIGRGLEALSQIASKGVVSMEEVRQQLAEAIPGAVQIAARSMDMTPAAFSKMVESGKLASDVFLPKFAAQLREEFGPAIEEYLNSPLGKARQEIGAFQTSANDLKAAAGEGFLEGMTSGLAKLNDELASTDSAANAKEVGQALGEGAAFAAEALTLVVDHLDEVAAAAQVVAGVGLVRFLMSTATAAQEAAAAYLLKAGAARSSALTAQQGLAAEAAALTGIRGALAQVAAAELATAQAVRTAALAREAGAKAAYDAARADLSNVSSSNTLAQRRAALAIAEEELTAARTASAAAAGRVAAAEAGQSRSLTLMGQAAGAAKGGMSALLGLVGGPWGAAMLAGGAAVWAVSDALADAKQRTADAEARTKTFSAAMDSSAEFLAEAATQAERFGANNDNAVGGTDALTGATTRLTEETWKLANARAEANRQMLNAAYDKLGEDLKKLQPNGFQSFLQTAAANTPTDRGGSIVRGAAAIFAPDTSADIAEIERQRTALRARTIEIALDPKSSIPETPRSSSNSAGASGSKSRRDRAGDVSDDLKREKEAITAHALALAQGETALDAWRVAQAGVEAVARAGLQPSADAAAAIREQAEEVERLTIAEERIEDASNFARSADRDAAALKRRADAAALGTPALEALRVSEAGLAQLQAARVTSLDQLKGPEREAVALAVAAAEAKERQAIATEKAEAAGKTVEQLNEDIAAEERRQASIGNGIAAEVAYARAEFVRQEVERAGLKVTDDAAKAIMDKANALFTLQAVTDGRQAAADAERELGLMRLTNRERDLAVRAERIINELLRERPDLTSAEAEAIAKRRAASELEAEEQAAAIGRLKNGIRDAFIKDGKLGIDQIADYALEQLRASIYDAFLAKPIDIVVNATVDIVNDLAKQILGQATGSGGFLSKLLGGSSGTGGLASLMGPIATAAAMGAMSSSLASGITGALGGNTKKASQWGWLGTIPGLIAGLTDKADRPYAVADVAVKAGQFVLARSQAADGGDLAGITSAGKALADQLNVLAKTFGIDLSKVENLYTVIGQTQGGNAKALGGDGFFGGAVNGNPTLDANGDIKGATLSHGVTFSQGQDAEAITEQIIRDTLLRAINAGASDLSEAEKRFVAAADSLDDAIEYIQTARGFGDALDDMLMELLDPAAFERKKALDAVEASYEALKAQATELVNAGLLSADALVKIEQLHGLQLQEALDDLAQSTDPMVEVRRNLQAWLDGLAVSTYAPGSARDQRAEALRQYQDTLALARTGDTDALDRLTDAADRLLSTDRTATGSATDRRALYEQVTSEVAALASARPATQPLTPGAITDPIVAALSASRIALVTILAGMPAETAAPLLAALQSDPAWAPLLQEAIGTDLTLSIDDLSTVLNRLLTLLGAPVAPVVTPPVVVTPTDPVVPTDPGGPSDPGGPTSPYTPPVAPDLGGGLDRGNVFDLYDRRVVVLYAPAEETAGAADTATARSIETLARSLEAGLTALQTTFDTGLTDLADATVAGMEGLTMVSADQLNALEDLGSAQRVTNAHMIARQAA